MLKHLIEVVNVHDVSITYLGGPEILTEPLYVKWSRYHLSEIKASLANVKTDLGNVEPNMDNTNIIAYLSTLIRIGGLI